jgi:hypothetical protein
MALGLNFALLQPFGGHPMFSLIYLLVAKLWYVCFQSMLLLNSRSKLSFHILDINLILGLTSLTTRMEAFTHSWISLCSNLSFFS